MFAKYIVPILQIYPNHFITYNFKNYYKWNLLLILLI